jgi:integrase
MPIKRNRRFHAEVATSALSDIMFFLLLFFLIISTLANPNVIKMTLPKSKTSEKTNKQLISLSITEDKRYYLDKEEIEQLANLEIDDQRLALYRDFFLFACYTGLAYSDIQQFKREHIKLDTDGTYYIKKPRQKTGGISIIPLLDPAIRILEKYSLTGDPRDFIWHVVCNQILNRHLKKIARMAKIDKQLFMHLARHTFATTVTLSNGVPLETVSKMLGHTSLKHTVRYARVVAEKIKNDMGRVRGVFK